MKPPEESDGMDRGPDALIRQAREASELMKALSHETRLVILCHLCDGEKSVSELETLLGMPQATVSQQLARLRLDRLVSSRRDGRTIYYSVMNNEVSTIVKTLQEMFCAVPRRQVWARKR